MSARPRSIRTRSPSPPPSSKRRRYDDDNVASSSSRPDDLKDRDRHERGNDKRDPSRERERRTDSGRERERDSHRSSRRHDSPPREELRRSSGSSRRDRSRDRDGRRESERDSRDYKERERGGEREYREREYERERGSDRDRHRDGDSRRRRDSRERQVSRSYSPEKRERSLPLARRESPVPPPPKAKPAFVSTFSSPAPPPLAASPAPKNGTPVSASGSPLPGGATDKVKDDEEKLRLKREKLEAWKANKKAKDAATAAATPPPPSPTPTSTKAPPSLPPTLPSKPQTPSKPQLPAKPLGFHPATSSSDPAALALAAAAAITSRITPPTTLKPTSSLPAKPSFSFSSTAFKPSGLKNSLALGEDDEGARRVGLVEIKGEVDMSVAGGEGEEEEEDDEEDLEGGVVFKKRDRKVEEEEDVVMGEPEEDEKMDEDEKKVEEEEEEEVDELEMFMSGVQAQVKSVDKEDRAKLGAAKGRKLADAEAEEEEVEEVDSEDELEKVGMKAEDILALAAKKVVKRGRELHSVDHSKITYEPFRKAFYHAPPEVDLLTPEEVEEMRLEMDGIKVRGADPPKPVAKWSYCGLPAPCIEVIKGLGYTAPTSIQSQAIPAIMSGRDIIGVAKTGSGKTMAFIAPMFRHIKDQRPIRSMEGPIAMIMTPTRELATQIHKECKPFLKALGLRASCAYGGTPLKDNIAEMKRGSEVVVCTPGRMIELLTTNSGRIINLQRITYLVLDEADRMFDMGFEPQVMKIINQIRPDRQTVLFSATFPRQMEALARKILRRPLEITVGGRSIVAPEIEQIVEVREEATKFNRLLELLGNLTNEDADARALIFVERQDAADKLLTDLLRKNYSCMSLHGGMEQVDRDQTIADFKSGVIPIVIATSVAARGLDVKQLKLVVQFDAPNHMEDYVHRAGRTGRAGNKGVCVTFVTPDQDRYALDIFKALTASNATVSPELKALAESFADKVKSGKASGAGSGFGGKGLERLDTERDAQSRAERAAYGEAATAPKPVVDEATGEAPPVIDVADLEIEIHKGPAPDTSKGRGGGMAVNSLVTAKAAEQAALLAGKPAGIAKAQGVIANINAMLKAKMAGGRPSETDTSTDAARRRDPDATDYHAIVYINDYPQKARWKVTNKDTMVQLVETTGASITNKGTFYEPGKEPKEGELPKLHLLIESNDEFRVKHAISEIKRSLIEGATMALEAEQRNGPNVAPGRYTV